MIDKKLQKRLLLMAKKDQEMRLKAIKTNRWDAKIDLLNTKKMKQIIKSHGWPGKSLVGKKGADAAWLLVQHADHDIKFQKECLALLGEAVKLNEAEPKHYAYLIDRVLVKEFNRQIFGTQFKKIKEKLVPFPIYDIKNLDKRRKLYGLETFKKYIKKIKGDLK